MTKEEYTLLKIELDKKQNEERIKLHIEYAKSNNSYNIGDIIKDNIGSIKIEKISYTLSYLDSFPICVYMGFELKKDGTPRKDGSKRSVYQTSIIP